MSNKRLVTLYYNINRKALLNSDGSEMRMSYFPFIVFRENIIVNLHLVTDDALTAYARFDGTETFEASIDNVFNGTTNMCKTLNAGINVAGDWAGSSGGQADEEQGEFSIRINANTTAYQSRISDDALLLNTSLELKALDANNVVIGVFRMDFNCENLQGDNTSTPVDAVGGWEEYTDEQGRKCFRLVNSDGQVLDTICPS